MNRTAVETIKLFHDKTEMEDFLSSSQAKFWAERGYKFRSLTAEECERLEPGLETADSVGGVLCGSGLDSSGDVLLYTKNIARLAASLGVEVRCGQEVVEVEREEGRVSGLLLRSGERVSAEVYVLATGARLGELARQVGIPAPVYPLKAGVNIMKLGFWDFFSTFCLKIWHILESF